ncbi:MAG: class I adenylate-forming enzyme family protein [Candidatus Dormibacteria bacterium]
MTSQLPSLRAGDVVAAALAPGPEWVGLLRATWDARAALLPIDNRLPRAEQQRLVLQSRPTVIVTGDDVRRVEGVAAVDDVAIIVATSGTTATPRLVELTRNAVTASVTASAQVLGATSDDPWLCCIPVAHIGGLLVLLREGILGARVTVHRHFDADAVARATDIRFTSLVPTQLRRLVDGRHNIEHLRGALVGGASLGEELRARAVDMTRIVATYGLSESCGGVVYDGVPLPGVDVRIANGDEVQLRGPTLMRGYRFDEDATAAALTHDGWLRTRDAGELQDGRLRVLGRIDDAITTGGETVWPLEVESVLVEHPDVREVAIAARHDAEWGERVVAFVVPSHAHEPPAIETLRTFVAERIAAYKAPRELVVVDHLDRTSLGKIRRDRLTQSRPSML